MGVSSLADLRSKVNPTLAKASDEELVIEYAKDIGRDPQEIAEYFGIETGRRSGAFGAGFGMGVDQAQSMVAGAGAALADVVGATGVRDALEAEARQQQAQSYLARNPEVAQRVEDIRGLGDVPGYIAGQLGQQVPIVGGILGASALGTLAGGPVGGVAAGLGTSYTYGVGSLYNEALEGGERKTAEALTTAVPYALAEAAVPFGIGRIARGAGVPGVSSIASRRGRVAAAGGAGAATEAATEAFQTSLEIGMRDDLSPEEIYSRYLNAAVSGGLVGGGFSAAGATFGRAPQPETQPDADVTDTDVDTGPVDTAPENNVVPDTEGGVNLAGSQAEVDANRVAQEQAPTFGEQADALAQQAIPDLLAIEQSLKEQAGRKLAKGGELKLKNRVKRLRNALKTSTGDTALGQQDNLNAALADLQAHEQAVEAEAALARLEEGITPELYAAEQGMFASLREELLPLAGEAETDTAEAVAMQGDLARNLAALSEAEADMSRGGVPYDVLSDARQKVERSRETSRRQARAKDALLQLDALERDGLPAYISQPIEARKKALKAALAEQRKGRADVTPEAVEAVSPVAETDLSVAQPATEPTPEKISQFVDYFRDFYSETDYTDRQFTDDEIRQAVQTRLQSRPDVPFDGDSSDRELVYDIITARETATAEPTPEAISPVVEEELVTAEDIEAEAQVDVEDVDTAVNKLNAEVASGVGAATGRVTLDQQVLRGAVEMMRSTKPNPKPVVRKEGSPAIDAEATEANAQQLTAIHEAFKNAVIAARTFNNLKNRRIGPKLSPKDDRSVLDLETETAIQQGRDDALELEAAGREVSSAMDALVQAAGGSQKNVEALVAIFKAGAIKDAPKKKGEARVQSEDYMQGLFNSKEVKQRGQYLTKADTVFSNAWASYKDNALTGPAQTAPEGREKRLSSEEVDQGFLDELTRAATQGEAASRRGGKKEKGLRGILNLVGGPGRGTPRVGSLAMRKMLVDTLRDRVQDAKVQFIPKGETSYYDPSNDTVYLRENTTPEEIVHESLHAALQGYVYRNSTAPEVELLKNTLDDIINFVQSGQLDGVRMSAADKQTATDVVNTLARVRGRSELAAVLELISYGNTLAEFKQLTTQVKARDAKSKTFLDSLNNAWRYLTELVAKFLGVENTAANDILNTTASLLDKARQEGGKPVARGAKLRQEVRRKTAAKPAEQVDVRKYGTQGTYGLTKPVFDLLGKAFPGVPAKLKKLAEGVRKAIIEAFPGAEKILRGFNPQMAFGETLKKVFQTFKNEKHTGIQLAELVSNHLSDLIQRDIVTAQKFIDYLDGNKAALNGVPDAELLKTRADNLLETIEEFKTALPETYKQFFDGRKFSESLIFVEEETDIGSGSVGQRKLSKIFGGRKQDLEKSDNPEWLGLKKEGDVFDSGAVYYRVMGETEGRPDPTKTIGFVREDQANAAGGITIDNDKGESFPIDMNAKWSGKDLPGKRFTFTTNKSVAEALKDANKMQAADQISAAILNTANTLGTYYASKKFLSGLANVGRDANGNIDPAAFERGEVPVVFKDVAEYNRYLEMTAAEGETVRPYDKKVQTANAAELKTGAVAGEFRRQGTLIQIPDTTAMKSQDIPIKVWGDLAGKVVSGPVYAAIQDMSSKHTMFDKGAMRTYNDALRQFKLSKTTRNPGTHITNVASNVTIMMMHGITFKTAKEAASILYRAARNPGALTKDQLLLLKEFEKSGALLGNFSASEVKKTKYREMRDKIKPDNDNRGVMGRVSELLRLESDNAKAMGNYLLEKDRNLLELYAAEDNVFRLAAFMNRAGELQSANDGAALTADQWKQAGDFGREAFLNYDIDAKYLQYARQTVMPFASWTYAAIPMLGKIAVTRPWMIANVLTSYALLDAAMSALAGEDEEDRNRLGKMYNEKLFFNTGPNSMIRIPFMGDDENPVYFRLGDYIPLASTMRGTPAGFMGFENWPGGFSPNGPLVTLAGMFMNTDTYTGKKISDPTDSALDVTLNNLGMMVDMALPPVISTRNVGKAVDFIQGDTTISGRDISPMLFARAAGLKFYNPNVTEETMYKRIAERQIIRDYGIAISRAKREELRSGAPDYDALYAEIDSLRQEMREEIDKLNNRD